MEPLIRHATQADIGQLVEMRSDFTFEDTGSRESTRPTYAADCRQFLARAIDEGTWQIWVAEADGQLAAHVFVALVDKMPRPIRENSRIAYLTNVYTRPGFRGQGIGSRLIERAQEAAREASVELMIVWPSDESIPFYRRHGFDVSGEPLIWQSRRDR